MEGIRKLTEEHVGESKKTVLETKDHILDLVPALLCQSGGTKGP